MSSTYPAPGPCTGDCWAHDLGLYQRHADGKSFRFASGDGIYIHEANSFIGPWKVTGVAFSNGSIIDHPGRTKLWISNSLAPDVHYEPESKKYYIVIGAASSPDMTPGSWTDHGAILHSTVNSRYNAFDANWVSAKAKSYLKFGSYWDGLFQVPMDKPVKIQHGSESTASNLAYNSTANHHIEAPFMFQHDECHGDFVDKFGKACLESGGTTLLASHDHIYGPGGQGIFEDKQFGHVLYYHYADKSIGLSPFQNQFGWNEKGLDENQDDIIFIQLQAAVQKGPQRGDTQAR
ncbi:glycosyl hydrolase [Aspergillus cavernicola]|uniref:Glycosyl hydrolase n=1 Tax=Aspergillus cavernicola TaxID=176166 RepID=A0ABR4ISR1_9EURO